MSSEERAEFRRDVLTGLAASQKYIPGKYLWDDAGSVLFDRICEVEDYYQARQETALLRREAGTIAQLVGADISLVEYGSGAGHKVRILLNALQRPKRYIGLDIAGDFLASACARLAEDYPSLDVVAVCADYSKPITLPPIAQPRSVLGFFPGTSIGNFEEADVVAFLSRVRDTLGSSWFLIGADPNADEASLAGAYADRQGLMAAFHGNVLFRVARELGGDLQPENFRHEARILRDPLRVEAHLVAQDAADYMIDGGLVRFAKGESIFTDKSYKHDPAYLRDLAAQAGWEPVHCWVGDRSLSSLHLLRA
jgi:dimethylhistidine N-methyltransferase